MIKLLFDNDSRTTDLDRSDGLNIATSDVLDTAIFISLFTRRLALVDDVLPDPRGTREGWWADPYEDIDGDFIGSRLWLLRRNKLTQSTINQAKIYAEEALQWLIDDEVAKAVTVETERRGNEMLAFKVSITKPDKVSARWEKVWTAHLALL